MTDTSHLAELLATGSLGAALCSVALAGVLSRYVTPFVDNRIADYFTRTTTRDSEKQRISAVVEDTVRRDDGVVRKHVDDIVNELRQDVMPPLRELGDSVRRIEGILRERREIPSPPTGAQMPSAYRDKRHP